MLNISFKVSVRRNSNACTHTQKTRAPQSSNGTDSGLKSRRRITCKRALFPWNDLDQFWLNFVENDHIFLANARKSSSFTDQNVGNENSLPYIDLLFLWTLTCHSCTNYEVYLPSVWTNFVSQTLFKSSLFSE